uniref:Uncharacterized protein n=1 Tax=Romanomermis culicivorax TaxID=13658 RepID=A0A915JPS6_ROMCU
MVPPPIILTRHKLTTPQEIEITTPVNTDSRTPVFEVKEDRLCDEHGQPIRDIRAYQFLLSHRRNTFNKQLQTIQDYLETHPEDPNYLPPPKKRRDSLNEK